MALNFRFWAGLLEIAEPETLLFSMQNGVMWRKLTQA